MLDDKSLQVVPIPAFRDNYIWLVRKAGQAAVVDPGDARPVLDYLRRERLQLCAILATHHHADHVGGIGDLLAQASVPVYGPRGEPIATLDHAVGEGDEVEIPELGLRLAVLDIPGHTRAHIAYYGAECLFCGDTLFACGCGRLFEGTPQQMSASLEKLARLPASTRLYCGHEYTMANIDFARAVESGNMELEVRASEEARKRRQDLPTLPSTIDLELRTNPFLRCHMPEVTASAANWARRPLEDKIAVFAALREWKNSF